MQNAKCKSKSGAENVPRFKAQNYDFISNEGPDFGRKLTGDTTATGYR